MGTPIQCRGPNSVRVGKHNSNRFGKQPGSSASDETRDLTILLLGMYSRGMKAHENSYVGVYSSVFLRAER